MKINVIYSVWGFGDEEAGDAQVLHGGEQDVEVTSANAHYFAGAASGPEPVIEIVDATDQERDLLDGHVQSQEDGEAAWQAAWEDGSWRDGHLQQWVIDTEHRLSLPDEKANLNEGTRAYLQQGLADAYEELGDERAAEYRSQAKASLAAHEAAEKASAETQTIGSGDVADASDVLGEER